MLCLTANIYQWHNNPPLQHDISDKNLFSQLPINFDQRTPISCFKLFWDDSITKKLVDETNLYSVQQCGNSINVTAKEMEQFLSIQMKIAISMPKFLLYWAKETWYEPIASTMSLK